MDNEEEAGNLWTLRYPLGRRTPTADGITVATTRPETMLGDTAVAVHPDDARWKDLIGHRVRPAHHEPTHPGRGRRRRWTRSSARAR